MIPLAPDRTAKYPLSSQSSFLKFVRAAWGHEHGYQYSCASEYVLKFGGAAFRRHLSSVVLPHTTDAPSAGT
jgi:hypothetical protein